MAVSPTATCATSYHFYTVFVPIARPTRGDPPMSQPVTAQFLFDFGSPNAYLAHQVIPGIEARTGVRFDYVPVLLGGLFKLANNRSPAEAFATGSVVTSIPEKSTTAPTSLR